MNISFFTLGCKVNQYETQSLRELFKAEGFNIVGENADFDIAVINSCTVTAESDRKTRQLLHRLRRENPNTVIVLTGCMVQAFSKESAALSDADIIVGNCDVSRVVYLTKQFLQNGERIVEVTPHTREQRFNTPDITDFAERTRAYMKIEDGCNRYCSYCIIPYARGFVRSKPLKNIRDEAESLAKKGFIEVVLVGINLSAYGNGEDFNLCDAVDEVCKVAGIKRVRLGSLEPDHISDSMLERFKSQPKFCPQFHLSLQSGCDKTLKSMNRHYDSYFYADLITRIRKMFPQAAITTDIMVGFAGETEQDFEESLGFMKKIGFAKTHVFAYSRRQGTVAYNMPNQISKSEKIKRSRIMLEAAAVSEESFLKSLVGKTVEVLFETYEKGKNNGYTPCYSRVFVDSDQSLSGQIKKVKITDYRMDYCIGECVDIN